MKNYIYNIIYEMSQNIEKSKKSKAGHILNAAFEHIELELEYILMYLMI